MRYLLMLPMLFMTGCGMWAGTEVQYEAETGSFHFQRPWLGGPVEATVDVIDPSTGKEIHVVWKSDVNLDAAQTIKQQELENTAKVIDLANTAVGIATAVAPTP